MKYLIFCSVLSLFCFSCTKPKYNQKEQLDYFVKISLKVKEAKALVKEVNLQLNDLYSIKAKNKNIIIPQIQIEDAKQSLQQLGLIVATREKNIMGIPILKGDFGLRKNALDYLEHMEKIVRKDFPELLEYISETNQQVNQKNTSERMSRMMMFEVSADILTKSQNLFKELYKLNPEELAMYSL